MKIIENPRIAEHRRAKAIFRERLTAMHNATAALRSELCAAHNLTEVEAKDRLEQEVRCRLWSAAQREAEGHPRIPMAVAEAENVMEAAE